MQLPNKLYSYKNSTLALVPVILNKIKDEPMMVYNLFQKMKPSLTDAIDFLSAMDCLYALRAIDINDKGEVFICLQ